MENKNKTVFEGEVINDDVKKGNEVVGFVKGHIKPIATGVAMVGVGITGYVLGVRSANVGEVIQEVSEVTESF